MTEVGLHEKEETRSMLIDSVSEYCNQELPVGRIRELNRNQSSFSRESWREMCSLGWAAILADEKDNGLNLGFEAAASLCKQLGRVVAPEPMLECGIATSALASKIKTPIPWINQMLEGEKIIVSHFDTVAENHRIKANGSLKAEKQNNQILLNGLVNHVPLADVADNFIVAAEIQEETGLFLIEKGAPNLTLDLETMADGTFSGKLRFRQLHLPENCLIAVGAEAEDAISHSYRASSLCTGAYLNGLSERLLEITLDYLKTREQFGKQIGTFQALQHRAVDLYIQQGLTDAVTEESAKTLDSSNSEITQNLAVTRAKYRSNEASIAISRQAVQLHGGMGYTEECDVGLYLNRALVLVARFGNSAMLKRKIGSLWSMLHSTHKSASKCLNSNSTEKKGWLSPPDAGWASMSDDEFREISRSFLESEYPDDLRYSSKRLRWKQIENWYKRLSKIGWIAPAWPAKFGGMGLTPSQQMIYIDEQERWGVGRAPDMGIVMVGPLLIQHGTEEQRETYLPKILSGEHIWCQGYSEPNSGSDLASLSTRAEPDGDEFIINGQKTWTTLAQDATHMFCLARTSTEGKAQEGITFFLIDLNQPGITIRPIRNIAGHEEFCEVFLNSVRVPADCMVGGMNKGWGIAKALLSFERIFLGSPRQSQFVVKRLEDVALKLNLASDKGFNDRFTALKLDVVDLESNFQKFADTVRRGETLGPEVSVLKIWATETFAKLSELLIEVSCEKGGVVGPVNFADAKIDVLSQFYNARPATIYGGSNEIQRNIISKMVLGLPN